MLLVPATTNLLGDAARWAPAPLHRLYDRIGLNEGDDQMPSEVPVLPVPVLV